MREALAARNISIVFRFLKSRGWSRATIAAATGLSETRVREICHGRQVVTSYEVLERIADGLAIDRGYLGLAYTNAGAEPPSSPPVEVLPDPAGYAGFVGLLAAMAVGSAPHDLARLLPPTPPTTADGVPALVTHRHVEVLRAVCDRHRHFDAEQGGGSCRDSAAGYLRWASGMLASRFDSDDTERALKATLSELHQVVGWACHDLGDHAGARRFLAGGLALARQIDDLALVAGSFYRLGRVSIHQGNPLDALKLWQLGQIVAQDSGCLVSVAVLHANEAWAYAMLGNDERVRDAVARAEGELARVDAATVPSWARFFLAPADIDGIAGVIYSCLATHKEHRARYAPDAIERAERAYARRQHGEARSQAFDAISLATGYLLDAQLDLAERRCHAALDMTTNLDSVRVVDRLTDMAAIARPHIRHSGIGAVLERIDTLATR